MLDKADIDVVMAMTPSGLHAQIGIDGGFWRTVRGAK